MPPKTQLDHVIILLPHNDVVHPPSWITSRFTVSPGGRHADGKTENRLIMFRDGTYIELIAFIRDDPTKRKDHWWDKDFGVVDFALTTTGTLDWSALQARLAKSGSGISYAEPRAGGRTKSDGQEIKWMVTFPKNIEPGAVPFWCHDVTPRDRRVPAFDGNTYHPCGAVGLAGVVVEVGDSQYARVGPALGAITEAPSEGTEKYYIGTPFDIGRAEMPTIHVIKRGDENKTPRLTLVVHCPGRRDQSNIRQTIKGGTISVDFEPAPDGVSGRPPGSKIDSLLNHVAKV